MGLSLIPSSKVSKNYKRKSQIVNALCPVYDSVVTRNDRNMAHADRKCHIS